MSGSVGPLGIGTSVLWLSIIVLLPLAALTVKSFDDGWSGFWDAVTAPAALDALRVTVLVSVIVTAINVVMGTLIAWVLVRDDFPGKGIVNGFIDLPFALPTIVASIVLLALYGPQSPLDIHLNATQPGLVVALAFVTLPFVVRSVQPVLIEADRDVEQAAASLGADNWTTFRTIILPTLAPAIVSGSGLAFARAIGEYGSVVLIGGGIPKKTQMASQYIQQQIEVDRPVNAAAVSVALLAISLLTLFVLRVTADRLARKEREA
ncbi:sulfate ABC transporter permease subunit CysT [Nocardia sp. CDC153]|nr:sulfate ABC transporter permease subunit CysT [Nocardia sp. CDC153]MEC3957334.1 sulfate ABC transporter permease subunit CysT [Nocardia sp. CDC153]